MRLEVRGLAQHGRRPGGLGESWPGMCDFVHDGRPVPPTFSVPYRTVCPDRSCPAASLWNIQLLLCIKCTQPSVMSYVTQGRHSLHGTFVGPCLLSRSRPYLYGGSMTVTVWAQHTHAEIWMSHKTFQQTFAEDMLHVCVFVCTVHVIVCMCAVGVFVSLNIPGFLTAAI